VSGAGKVGKGVGRVLPTGKGLEEVSEKRGEEMGKRPGDDDRKKTDKWVTTAANGMYNNCIVEQTTANCTGIKLPVYSAATVLPPLLIISKR